MNKKHWIYQGKTPAQGESYVHKSGKRCITIYRHKIRLFLEIPSGKNCLPCNSKRELVRLRTNSRGSNNTKIC